MENDKTEFNILGEKIGKKDRRGLKIFLIILVIFIVLGSGIYYVYSSGYFDKYFKKDDDSSVKDDTQENYYSLDNLLAKGILEEVGDKGEVCEKPEVNDCYVNDIGKLVVYDKEVEEGSVATDITDKVSKFTDIYNNDKLVNRLVLTENGNLYYLDNDKYIKVDSIKKILNLYKTKNNDYYVLLSDDKIIKLNFDNGCNLGNGIEVELKYINVITYKEKNITKDLVHIDLDNKVLLGDTYNSLDVIAKYVALIYKDEAKNSADLYIVDNNDKFYVLEDVLVKNNDIYVINNNMKLYSEKLVKNITFNNSLHILYTDNSVCDITGFDISYIVL